jgi:hypothetical protein
MSADRSVTATFGVAPPNTKISKASISSKNRKAAFKFKAIGSVSHFQCALRPPHSHKTTFKSCRSPKTYKHLKPGKYTFEVRAIGPGGTDPSPAKKSFKINS